MGIGYCPANNERKFYSVDYSNGTCIQALFKFYHKLKIDAQSTMNTELICILSDLETAILKSNMSDSQAFIVRRYISGYTMQEMATELGINRSSVCRQLKTVIRKMQKYLKLPRQQKPVSSTIYVKGSL